MKKFLLSDIEDAFFRANFGNLEEKTALICRDTGEILFYSEENELDEEEDINWDASVEVPPKYELKLGKELAFSFAAQFMPEEEHDLVYTMFRQRGGFSTFKSFLDLKGMLEQWYDFEKERETSAIREWCKQNQIKLSD